MKVCFILANRNIKEMVRSPLSLIFCLGFPIIMLLLMQLIFSNIKGDIPSNFVITNYANGICVFGYAFTSLFVAIQISSDKNTSFIKRINIAPITKFGYYFSFFISSAPIILIQTILFFLIALIFKFPFNYKFILNIIYLLPSAFFYISFGVLIGSICKNEKQSSPMISVFITLVGIFGGVFMPLDNLSSGFNTFINLLPFSHSVYIGSKLYTIGPKCIYPHIIYLLIYTLTNISIIAIIEFIKSIKR